MADRKQVALRLAFIALLAGGLVLWMHLRAPKQVTVVVDLAEALPGELSGVDVIVSRSGRALARVDRQYAAGRAPQSVPVELKAPPGAADVEVTAIYPGRPARRATGQVELREGAPARFAFR